MEISQIFLVEAIALEGQQTVRWGIIVSLVSCSPGWPARPTFYLGLAGPLQARLANQVWLSLAHYLIWSPTRPLGLAKLELGYAEPSLSCWARLGPVFYFLNIFFYFLLSISKEFKYKKWLGETRHYKWYKYFFGLDWGSLSGSARPSPLTCGWPGLAR